MSTQRGNQEHCDRRHSARPEPEWEPAATPFSLAPQELRGNQAKSIQPRELRSTEVKLVEHGRREQAEVRPVEHRYEFVEPGRIEFSLKGEVDAGIQAIAIPLNPLEISEMRERRVGAVDLGWKVPGLRIRNSDQE